MKIFLLFLFSIFLFNSNDSCANELEAKINLCSKIENNIERLECYDNITNSEKSLSSNQLKNWNVRTDTSKLTDETNVYITTSSIDPIKNQFGQRISPTLILRCAENTTNLFVTWEMFLGTDTIEITERIDKEKVKKSTWTISTDHKASFKRQPIDFIKKLEGKQVLLLELTPYGESPRMVEFDITGIEEVITPLKNACNW